MKSITFLGKYYAFAEMGLHAVQRIVTKRVYPPMAQLILH